MTEKHLGESVAAVADGHCGGAARDRALAHLARCATCRDEVELHRAMRSRLAALEVPAPPTDVTAVLLALAPQGHQLAVAPHGATFGGVRRRAPLERPAAHAFSGRSRPTRAGRRRIVAAGVLAVAALSGGATLGMRSGGVGSGSSGPVVNPGDIELSRYTDMSRSVVMDDPAPVLAASHH